MPSRYSTNYHRALLLAIFLFSLLFQGQNAIAQTKDTLWTRDVWPLYVINGVFSPDDKFIYATGASDGYGKPPHHLMIYDLQGNQLAIIDTIPGLKQYSHDGIYFWDINGNKYDASTFKRLQKFAEGNYNISGWMWEINSLADIGIGSREGNWTETETRRYYDSNLIFFRPSNMEVLKYTSYPGKAFEFNAQSINPDGIEVAFLVSSYGRDWKGNGVTDTARIELWDIKTFTKKREINIPIPKNFDNLKLKYSPDGSVLGYQHDGKLTLYSTTDYSVVWESDKSLFLLIYNFTWTKDSKNMFISFYTDLDFMGVCRLNNINKSIEKLYLPSSGTLFINCNNSLTQIITHLSNSLELLNYNPVNIRDDFFEKFRINIFQDQTTNEFSFKINSPESAVGNYTISNMLGEIMQNPIQINISEGSNQVELNTADFPTGIYFLMLTISGRTQTMKFAVVR